MWKTGGLIDSLQWSLTFSLLPGKKQAMAWCLHCRFKRKKKKKKDAFPNKWKRLFGEELGQVIWALASNKLFGGASKYHHTSNKYSSQQGFAYINLRVIDSSLSMNRKKNLFD